jgi:putative hydrolase of the HAD superfamily
MLFNLVGIIVILLDLDDTLIDHTGAERNAASMFGAHYADSIPGYDVQQFVHKWHEAAEMHMAAFLRGEIDFQEQRRRRVRAIFAQYDISANEADAIFSDYLKHYEAAWRVFPDVLAFLDVHANECLAVLSDGAQKQQEAKLKKTGIRRYFQFVVTAESTRLSKPNPLMFLHACELANVEPGEVCYIGDNLQKDAIGASKAGLWGIWLNRSGKPIPEGVASISSLAEYLPNFNLRRNK